MKNKRLKDELENIARHSIPEDIHLWPKISTKLERSSSMLHLRYRPFMAILTAVLSLLVLSGAAYALSRSLGYTPEVGLVDNSAGIRMLVDPVAVTRDGVTLTISSVFAHNDHIELVYDVKGISPENDASQSADARTMPADFCGGVNIGSSPITGGDARLLLPDGTVLERDYTGKYAQNVFSMKPVYSASLPADVTTITFLLDCIPQTRRGTVPENWAVPLNLKTVPAGTVVGAPVVEVEPIVVQPTTEPTDTGLSTAQTSTVPTSVVTMNLAKIVPLDTRIVFYFSMEMENKDPSLISIMPVTVYVVDSQGQKIQLIGNFAWQPFEHRVGSEFEFTSQVKPAEGPLTLVVENAIAYYAPLYVIPQQATPDEMSFTFNAGANPQYGQIWNLENEFEIAGYALTVTSARAASYEDIKSPRFIDGSQGYEFGYDFAVEADPSVKMQVEMDIMLESPTCWLSNSMSNVPERSSIHYIQLCRGEYPTGNVRVTIRELSVLLENSWQVVWIP
jgi:hypothetical protein